MCRRARPVLALLLCGLIAATGCHPQQPFYFHEDGDLSHYIDTATDIEYPDVETESLEDVKNAAPPLSLDNPTPDKIWDLKLEEAIQTTLCNSKVMRSLSGRYLSQASLRAQTGDAPDALLTRPEALRTVYDPAIVETSPFGGNGLIGVQGVEAALSAFDAQLASSLFWSRNNRQQNVGGGQFQQFFVRTFEQDTANHNASITKTTATGGTFAVREGIIYDANNNPTRQVYSDWDVTMQMDFSQPLLQGAGVQYNRIAGPNNPFNGVGTQQFDGVMLARINTDLSLAEFESGVRDMVSDAENAYWELYFAYRNLEAGKAGRASALQTWQKVHALYLQGGRGGELDKEAQAREQYFFFRSQVQQSLNDLYRAENRLRYMMGISVSDGRLIRPADEPTTAHVVFDWYEIHCETLSRVPELREQKWRIKQRELELIAARNLIQPRLDAAGYYRWRGLGDELLNYRPDSDHNGLINTNAFGELTGGKYQEWQFGFNFQMPIGFRRELSAIRHYQLQLARERARLQDAELEASHQLGDAVRNLDGNYDLAQTNFNRRVAAEKQVEAVKAAFDADTVTLDLLLDAQRRRADAEVAYYRSLVDYVRGITLVHYRKGSLLEYNGIYLAEGPWPNKAYFDAERMARQRDASYYLDYGYTRPQVVSQGPYLQHKQDAELAAGEDVSEMPMEAMPMDRTPLDGIDGMTPEEVPAPMPAEAQQGSPILKSPTPTPSAPKASPNGKPSRAIRPTTPGMERRITSPTKRPNAAPTTAKESTGYDWGTLGLDANKPKSRLVARPKTATAEPKAADKPEQVVREPRIAVKPAAAIEARVEAKSASPKLETSKPAPQSTPAAPSKSAPVSEPKVDNHVKPASHNEWQPKSQAAAAKGKNSTGWKAVR